MDTESTNQATTPDGKIIFDERQQAKVNELIKEAQGRAARDVKVEADSLRNELTTLKDEFNRAQEALKAAKTPTQKKEAQEDLDEYKAKVSEMSTQHKNVLDELTRVKQSVAQKEAELAKAKEATVNVRKEVLLTSAASKINPFEVDEVVRATFDSVVWDDTKNSFIVVDPATKQPRLNSAFEPMGLDEYMQEFATKKPYMVRGGTKTGTGSSESGRFDVSGNGKYTVDQIFGPTSNSQLANDLAKKDIKEYRRLKEIAQSSGVLPR